jgi:predicted ferric reductase
MWAVFAVALLAALRRRLGLRLRTWRIAHMLLAIVIVAGSVIHGILIEGMDAVSKAAVSALVLAATAKVMADLWGRRKRATLELR